MNTQLTPSQIAKSAGMGAFWWGAAAVFLNQSAPALFSDLSNPLLPALYVGIIPASVPVLKSIWAVVRPKNALQRRDSTIVSLIAATFIDGVVIMWLPWIYGQTGDLLARTGASILAGVGALLLDELLIPFEKEEKD